MTRCTHPKSFWISVFSKQKPNEEGKPRDQHLSHEYHVFSPVADPFPYKEAIEDTFVPQKEVFHFIYIGERS